MAAAFFTVPAGAAASLFVVEAVTWRGVVFGLAGLLAAAASLRCASSRGRDHDVQAAVVGACAVVAVVVLWIAAPAAPAAAAPGDARGARVVVRSVWQRGAPTASPAWWIPEIDQIAVGAIAAAMVDPILTLARGRGIQKQVVRGQLELLQDSEIAGFGNALHPMWTFGGGHRYEILPPVGEERPGAVIFLHGSGGNFQFYLLLWKRIAADNNLIVILPSHGVGNWDRGGLPIIEEARQAALSHGADPARIVLAGLSNGGKGVTRALVAGPASPAPGPLGPERWAGAVLLSAVSEKSVLSSSSWACAGKPVLLLHGGQDDRVYAWVAVEAEAALTEHGCVVERPLAPGRDHFWALEDPAETAALVSSWWQRHLLVPGAAARGH